MNTSTSARPKGEASISSEEDRIFEELQTWGEIVDIVREGLIVRYRLQAEEYDALADAAKREARDDPKLIHAKTQEAGQHAMMALTLRGPLHPSILKTEVLKTPEGRAAERRAGRDLAARGAAFATRSEKAVIYLDYPFEVEGTTYDEIRLHPPSFIDVEDYMRGLISRLELYARMAKVDVAVLKAMRWMDSERVAINAEYLLPQAGSR